MARSDGSFLSPDSRREAVTPILLDWRAAPRGLRYVFVGGVCAALNNILLIAAVSAGLHYLNALCLVCLPMLVLGYVLQVKVTFEAVPSTGSFLRYSLAILASYPIWIASLYVLCDVVDLRIYIAGPIATVTVFAVNYVAAHWAIERSLRSAFRFARSTLRPPRALL